DWEDIAIDEQNRLYLADIGNNSHARREIQIYRMPEPDPHTPLTQGIRPDQPFDAESLFLLDGNGYIIAKYLDGKPADVYKFNLTPPANSAAQTLKKV